MTVVTKGPILFSPTEIVYNHSYISLTLTFYHVDETFLSKCQGVFQSAILTSILG